MERVKLQVDKEGVRTTGWRAEDGEEEGLESVIKSPIKNLLELRIELKQIKQKQVSHCLELYSHYEEYG